MLSVSSSNLQILPPPTKAQKHTELSVQACDLIEMPRQRYQKRRLGERFYFIVQHETQLLTAKRTQAILLPEAPAAKCFSQTQSERSSSYIRRTNCFSQRFPKVIALFNKI